MDKVGITTAQSTRGQFTTHGELDWKGTWLGSSRRILEGWHVKWDASSLLTSHTMTHAIRYGS